MSFEVIVAGAAEIEEWAYVVSWVYRQSAPDMAQFEPEDGETRLLVRSNGQPVAACLILDYLVARGRDDLTCGGVAAVATLPEHRRTGAASVLMEGALAHMASAGHAVSALYPYREPFYRKFGYQTCGWRWQIKCPQDRLPRVKSELTARQVIGQGLAELDPVYRQFIRQRSGSHIRQAADWDDRLGKSEPMVYVLGSPAEAYLWVNLKDFWGDINVGEIGWSTQRGYDSALALLVSLASNQSTVTWCEPPDSPFLARFLDQGVEAKVHRATMFRVIDAARALGSLKSDHEGRFCLATTGFEVKTWTVEFGPKGTVVAPGGDPGLEIDASHLGQAVMGQPSLAELRVQGLVSVVSEADFEAACRLMSPSPVVCMEFF